MNSDLKLKLWRKRKLKLVSFDEESSQIIEGNTFSESAPSNCIISTAQLKPNSHHKDFSYLVTKNNLLLKNESSPFLLSKSVEKEVNYFKFNYNQVHLEKDDTTNAAEMDIYASSSSNPEEESD